MQLCFSALIRKVNVVLVMFVYFFVEISETKEIEVLQFLMKIKLNLIYGKRLQDIN